MTLAYSFADLFAAADARVARDRALAGVEARHSDFIAAGLAFIGELVGEFTGEDIRLLLLERRSIVPPTPNSMGTLIMNAAKAGLLTDTGRSSRMKSEKSNARRTPVWRAGRAES
jgi:hypothetical protein